MAKKMKWDQAKKMMHENLQSTASQVGVFGEAESKIRAPVDTGHLRRSITHDTDVDKDKASVFVGTNVEYASTVELGLGNQQAQPYITPAINENVSTIQSIIQKGLKVK